MSSIKYPSPLSFSPATISGGSTISPSMVVGISGAPTFTGTISQPSPPHVQMSGWLTRVGASAPLTMRAAMSQAPFPSLLIAQLGPGARGGWNLRQGMQNPQYACGMWLYEIEFPSGSIFYVWVQPDGTILESTMATITQPVPTSLATPEDGNKQRGDSIGFGGEGGCWQGEKRSGDIGIAATADKLIIQTYHRLNGPEETDVPNGYILVDPSFMKDLMKAYSLYRDEQEGGCAA